MIDPSSTGDWIQAGLMAAGLGVLGARFASALREGAAPSAWRAAQPDIHEISLAQARHEGYPSGDEPTIPSLVRGQDDNDHLASAVGSERREIGRLRA